MAKETKNRLFRLAVYALTYSLYSLNATSLMSAQNFVPNGSFEEYTDCPKNYTEIGQKLQISAWYSPNRATPDYFNACSKFNVGIPNNFMGNTFAAHGNAYIGILLSEQPNRIADNQKPYNQREYIQVKLVDELTEGVDYIVRLKYCIAPRSAFAVNRLGICLSGKPLKSNKVIMKEPQVFIDTLKNDSVAGIWNELIGMIKAKGGERYLTIGNFYLDKDLKYSEMDLSEFRASLQKQIKQEGYSYYFIDQVSLEVITE